MIADAEAHEAEDQEFRELVEVRNQGDALVHATEKMLTELGEKVEADERGRVEAALSELKEAVSGDSKATIETKINALSEATAPIAQKMYAEQAQAGEESTSQAGGGEDDNVVDADFEEVKGNGEDQRRA